MYVRLHAACMHGWMDACMEGWRDGVHVCMDIIYIYWSEMDHVVKGVVEVVCPPWHVQALHRAFLKGLESWKNIWPHWTLNWLWNCRWQIPICQSSYLEMAMLPWLVDAQTNQGFGKDQAPSTAVAKLLVLLGGKSAPSSPGHFGSASTEEEVQLADPSQMKPIQSRIENQAKWIWSLYLLCWGLNLTILIGSYGCVQRDTTNSTLPWLWINGLGPF